MQADKNIRELKSKLAEIKSKVRALKRTEERVARFERNRELAVRLRDGDSILAKIMLAKASRKEEHGNAATVGLAEFAASLDCAVPSLIQCCCWY